MRVRILEACNTLSREGFNGLIEWTVGMRRRDNSFRFSDLTLTAVEKWKDSRQCDVESSEIIGSGLPNHRRAPNGPILEIVLLMLIISKIQYTSCPHTVLDVLLLTVELCEDGERALNSKSS